MARNLLALLCVLALSAPLAGCWVIDELDKGSDLMDKHSAKAGNDKKAAAEAAAASPAAPKGNKNALNEYFQNEEAEGTTKTFAPGTVSKDIVGCKIGGSVQFMKREQCAARGGRS